MMNRFTGRALLLALLFPGILIAQSDDPVLNALSMEKVIRRIVEASPDLAALRLAQDAAEAGTRQALLRPNPELEMEIENVGAGGSYTGFDAAEYTLMLSQEFETGGKRSARGKVASLDVAVAEFTGKVRLLEVKAAAEASFLDVLVAREKSAVAKRLVERAMEILEQARTRVEAGAAHAIEVTQAEIELAAVDLLREQAVLDLESKKRQLASMWGDPNDASFEITGDLYDLSTLAPVESYLDHLADHPSLKQGRRQADRWAAQVRLEDALAAPNLNLAAGIRGFRENGDQAFVAGLSLPLPLRNRNQGNRAAADLNRRAALRNVEDVEHRMARNLLALHRDAEAALRNYDSLHKRQIPLARKALEEAMDGYKRGRFGALVVFDAIRGLFEKKIERIESLRDYRKAKSELNVIYGRRPSSSKSVEREE